MHRTKTLSLSLPTHQYSAPMGTAKARKAGDCATLTTSADRQISETSTRRCAEEGSFCRDCRGKKGRGGRRKNRRFPIRKSQKSVFLSAKKKIMFIILLKKCGAKNRESQIQV